MKSITILALVMALAATPAIAQQSAAEQEEARRTSEMALRSDEQRLREAEQRLQAAAAEIAEISGRMAPMDIDVQFVDKRFEAISGPRLGVALNSEIITVDGETSGGELYILSVSPGSAAANAGVLAGDRLVSVGGEALGSDTQQAVEVIREQLKGKKVGDTVALEVLRDGQKKQLQATLNDRSFMPLRAPMPPVPPLAGLGHEQRLMIERELVDAGPAGMYALRFLGGGSPWASMELVELSPELGAYFGAEEGLLVVSAPKDESLGFIAGDVIRRIDDREPSDVGHAMRILRSFDQGETLKVEILRNKRRRTLEITVPEQVGRNDFEFGWHGEDVRKVVIRTPAPAPAARPLTPVDAG